MAEGGHTASECVTSGWWMLITRHRSCDAVLGLWFSGSEAGEGKERGETNIVFVKTLD